MVMFTGPFFFFILIALSLRMWSWIYKCSIRAQHKCRTGWRRGGWWAPCGQVQTCAWTRISWHTVVSLRYGVYCDVIYKASFYCLSLILGMDVYPLSSILLRIWNVIQPAQTHGDIFHCIVLVSKLIPSTCTTDALFTLERMNNKIKYATNLTCQ